MKFPIQKIGFPIGYLLPLSLDIMLGYKELTSAVVPLLNILFSFPFTKQHHPPLYDFLIHSPAVQYLCLFSSISISYTFGNISSYSSILGLVEILQIFLYSSKQQAPIVSLLCPCLNSISSASFTTNTSLAIYSFSFSLIVQPAYLNPVYSMPNFLCLVPKLSPIFFTEKGNNFSESRISIKWLLTLITIVYHIPLSDIEYLKDLLSIYFSSNHFTSNSLSLNFSYACLYCLSISR